MFLSRAPIQSALWHDPSDPPLAILNTLHTDGYGQASGSSYTSTPFTNGGAFDTVMSQSRRLALVAEGQQALRWCIDPGVFYATSGATRTARIATVRDHLLALVGDGLKVIANFHHNGYHPVLGWTRANVADGGTKFYDSHIPCAVEFAQMLHATVGLEASKVAFEPFNEPEFPSGWATMQEAEHAAVRAVLPNHTLIMCGIYWSNIDGLLATVDAENYDENTLFAYHTYDSQAVCFQASFSPYTYIHRLTFPPESHSGGKAAALTAYNAAVDAAGASAALKTEMADTNQSHTIANYFDTPKGAAWLQSEMQRAVNGLAVDPARIIVTECGCRGDFGGAEAADATSRANWYGAMRTAAENVGVAGLVAHELFGDNDGYGLCGTTASFAPVTALMDALRPA